MAKTSATTVTGRVLKVVDGCTAYGYRTEVTLLTADGNVVWFGTTAKDFHGADARVDKGDTLTVSGTVKVTKPAREAGKTFTVLTRPVLLGNERGEAGCKADAVREAHERAERERLVARSLVAAFEALAASVEHGKWMAVRGGLVQVPRELEGAARALIRTLGPETYSREWTGGGRPGWTGPEANVGGEGWALEMRHWAASDYDGESYSYYLTAEAVEALKATAEAAKAVKEAA